MDILIALLPAIGWGVLPIATSLIGGKPINQLLGTTYGAFIVALGLYAFTRPELTASAFFWCFLSGMAWTCGQFTQYIAFEKMGVSRTMPISTGMQLVGTSLTGIIFFGEWAGLLPKLSGFGAIILIIIGIIFTTRHSANGPQISAAEKAELHKNTVTGLLLLLLGTFGYIGYSAFPKVSNADGWKAFLPQTIGMLVMGTIFGISILIKHKTNPFKQITSYKNIITGFLFGFGALFYLVSTRLNGVATGFTLSQLCVVISTIGGIVVLHEHKTKREMVYIAIGLSLVIIGGILISFIHD
ncbi:ribose uptake protein RbsU [Fructilactobacillus lindneri]|uniref:Ribose uptake protein RbsU n=1 Tax=Fructilactobacillus lindneri TaxID=53444 RepID=A0AB33BPM4_9LACO|nr:GRP family sugar transporter [Fructilactobacillus lindneri]ANZ57441.1 ribose uptake protein RbsU [Fructilactobacillus lindneri]ANZ58708.1 ribose uptake protein RbsU [Fructilactobacillus lindneri]POG97926.1 ribose uptake protein RbsU [Fructilactobacillus lindneri]POG99258.1 ribose uptake protein RbsU [Fructilactobacillus lindneri]POH01895.1 ribose uptake protein RbsU [Fructilactobacillus lindneri]